jgi:hypothetical protein
VRELRHHDEAAMAIHMVSTIAPVPTNSAHILVNYLRLHKVSIHPIYLSIYLAISRSDLVITYIGCGSFAMVASHSWRRTLGL